MSGPSRVAVFSFSNSPRRSQMQKLLKQQGMKLTNKFLSLILRFRHIRKLGSGQVQTWESRTSGNVSIHHPFSLHLTNTVDQGTCRYFPWGTTERPTSWEEKAVSGWLTKQQSGHFHYDSWGSQPCGKFIILGDSQASREKFHGHKTLSWAFILVNGFGHS